MVTLPSAGTPFVDEIAERDPDLVSAGASRTWSVCGRNFVVAITQLEPGDRLTEHDVRDEYVLLVRDHAVVVVEHDGCAPVSVSEPALVVVPAGTSTAHARTSTTVTRVFTARSTEQMGGRSTTPPGPTCGPRRCRSTLRPVAAGSGYIDCATSLTSRDA